MGKIGARPTLAAPDDDPYLWLEAVDGPKAVAWADAQSAKTMARFGDTRFAEDRDALKSILDRPDNLPFVTRRGRLLYNFWKDGSHPRGLWRTTSFESYASETPEWEVVLDLDALAAKEGKDWIWQGASTFPGTHDRALMRLSRGGGDAIVHREFDLTTRAFIEGGEGFNLPEGKGGAAWLDRDTVLLSSALGEGNATRSGYARTVRLWKRGSDPLTAPAIFTTQAEWMSAWGDVDSFAKPEVLWFSEKPGFFDALVWMGDRTGAKRRLPLPSDAWSQIQGDWLAVKPRREWKTGGRTYAPDTVLGISLAAFLRGDRGFTTLFTPTPRRSLQNFFWCKGTLILSILDNLRPVFETATPPTWEQARIEGLPDIGVASVWPLDDHEEESNGDMMAVAQDPLTPATLYTIEAGKAPAVLKRAPANFNAAGLVVTRHEAISEDGTAIPYVQVGPPGNSGDAPVHLTGYGGFGISILPNYSSAIGKLWLERGGTSVTANIRGGGEFGTAWHEAGRREGKKLSHDDFAAVAADLVRRGVTKPARIAAEGGSNGGILITNMLTRYPDRFGALFCTIPLIDMRRYTKLLAGASWIAEYGDPDKADDWRFLQEISAYHTAVPGRAYPPILIATSRRDDRVHPGHARKMAAKLQAMGYNAWFYEPAAGGHGYGKDNTERAAFTALGYNFLRKTIGWE